MARSSSRRSPTRVAGRVPADRPSGSRSVPATRKDDGTQLARLRDLCLSMPGAVEKTSHGEPTFFTPKRVFAMFANNHHDDGHVAVWLPAGPGAQDMMIEEAPQIYFRPPYVGPAGWIGVELSRVDDDQLGALIREAFQLSAAKDRKTSGRRRVAPRRGRSG
ncbi:MAG TPA: MmcQ/YjbR family DNA-binding protein [Vicinamibacterales bacterium]|nr:MmcQ/YjbR family DNA-binding protein [Vicinamibacterales bacterium]